MKTIAQSDCGHSESKDKEKLGQDIVSVQWKFNNVDSEDKRLSVKKTAKKTSMLVSNWVDRTLGL